jgi:hypothetical protein
MKFHATAITTLLMAHSSAAFVPIPHFSSSSSSWSSSTFTSFQRTSTLSMAVSGGDMPPPPPPTSEATIVQANPYGAPSDVRYSDFLQLVNKDRIEKVTFSADGTQLLGVDTDGVRLKIEALPNDPDLLTQLTNHKVKQTNKQTNVPSYLSYLVIFRMLGLFCRIADCFFFSFSFALTHHLGVYCFFVVGGCNRVTDTRSEWIR